MQRNDKGVTMIILIITIIILVILTGVSLNTGYSVMRDIRVGRVISNMLLVKAKVETIYEEYQFSEDESVLVGNVTETIPNISQQEKYKMGMKDDWKWYQLKKDDLRQQGLNEDILGENEFFYVNYEHSEIVYSKGTTYDNIMYYSLTGLNSVYENN